MTDYGEPWHVDFEDGRCVISHDGFEAEFEDDHEKARRAVACVNACRGIKDPEKVVPLMVEYFKKQATTVRWNDVINALEAEEKRG